MFGRPSLECAVIGNGDNPKLPVQHLGKNQAATASFWVAAGNDPDMEMMKAVPCQNPVDILASVSGVRARKNHALPIHEVGEMRREVFFGLNLLQQRPKLR